MKEATLKIKNEIGLHAHPATFFIQAANSFKSAIWIEKDDKRSNAKSLLGVLSLGIVGGTTVRLIANGADEDYAISSLKKFINSGFADKNEIMGWLEELGKQ